MMDSVHSLESSLRKAVNPTNDELDVSALDNFCFLLEKDARLMNHATKLLANKVQSHNPREALLALEALEECMDSCGETFRSEINKFKFLNELIKLVSKKHDGNKTPKEVADRILNVLLTWTNKYDDLFKIKEAYMLLKTQGIEHEPTKDIIGIKNQPKIEASQRKAVEDKEALKLKKLLQSNKPEDRLKANLMIQNIYREDERKTQMKNRRVSELQKVSENTSLLNEMLDSYKEGETSEDELAIIREIYQSCDEFHPTVFRLAKETQQSEGMLDQILKVNDSLTTVLERYRQIFVDKKVLNTVPALNAAAATSFSQNISSSNSDNTTISSNSEILNSLFNIPSISSDSNSKDNMEELSEIFSSTISNSAQGPSASSSTKHLNSNTILTPLVVTSSNSSVNGFKQQMNKVNEIKELLSSSPVPTSSAINYNALSGIDYGVMKPQSQSQSSSNAKKPEIVSTKNTSISDLDSLISGIKSSLLPQPPTENVKLATEDVKKEEVESEDEKILEAPSSPTVVEQEKVVEMKKEIKSLAEIDIDLDNIQPSIEPSRTVLDENGGIRITLNFAKDRPRPDVTVIVISTINQGRDTITDYQFDASVSKPCKLRLLPASGTNLPGTKPFRPPADGITQVLLCSNPTQKNTDMTCILTYCVGDDPDPIKESIIVKHLPHDCN